MLMIRCSLLCLALSYLFAANCGAVPMTTEVAKDYFVTLEYQGTMQGSFAGVDDGDFLLTEDELTLFTLSWHDVIWMEDRSFSLEHLTYFEYDMLANKITGGPAARHPGLEPYAFISISEGGLSNPGGSSPPVMSDGVQNGGFSFVPAEVVIVNSVPEPSAGLLAIVIAGLLGTWRGARRLWR
jgi:hypothetical protein